MTNDVNDRELERLLGQLPNAVDLDPENPEEGLAKLVLTVVELLRDLLERQAIRRMESGSLDDEQIERLGSAFLRLHDKVDELKEFFGIDDDDLVLTLGRTGDLA